MTTPHDTQMTDTAQRLRMMAMESRARALFLLHPEPIFELDPEGRFRHANAAGATLAGLHENEGQGMHFSRFVLPDDRALVEQRFQMALSGRQAGCVASIRNLAGEQRQVRLSMLPIASEQSMLGVYVLVSPLGDANLSHSQEAKQLLEAIPYGAAVLELQSESRPVIMANRALSELLDIPEEVILGHPLPSLRERDSIASRRLEMALARRQPARETLSVVRRGGQPLTIELNLEPIASPTRQAPVAFMLALHVPLYGNRKSPGGEGFIL